MPLRSLLSTGLLLAVLLPCAVRGEPLDAASADALGNTLRMLEDPGARRDAGRASPSLASDPKLKAITQSPELTQELYELAAQIFSEITQRTAGDVDKMNEMMARGKSDPAAFAASLSPATRARLRAFADKVEAAKRN
jgi:hypothetical protein